MESSQIAIVIGKTIHLHNTSRQEFIENKRWLSHEMEHIRQYRKYGLIRFIVISTLLKPQKKDITITNMKLQQDQCGEILLIAEYDVIVNPTRYPAPASLFLHNEISNL